MPLSEFGAQKALLIFTDKGAWGKDSMGHTIRVRRTYSVYAIVTSARISRGPNNAYEPGIYITWQNAYRRGDDHQLAGSWGAAHIPFDEAIAPWWATNAMWLDDNWQPYPCDHDWYSPNPMIDMQAYCTKCGARET